MVNQGARGARAENAVADELGAMGHDVIRSAGSKGAADLVAVHDREVLFVQVKLVNPKCPVYTQLSPNEREQLFRIARRVGGFPIVAQRHQGRGSRPAFTAWYLLTGTGPNDRIEWVPRDSRAEARGEAVFS